VLASKYQLAQAQLLDISNDNKYGTEYSADVSAQQSDTWSTAAAVENYRASEFKLSFADDLTPATLFNHVHGQGEALCCTRVVHPCATCGTYEFLP
jgi:hypothetical protein